MKKKISGIIRKKRRALSDTGKKMSQTASKFTESVQQRQQRRRPRIYSRHVPINEILHFWLQSHSTEKKKHSILLFILLLCMELSIVFILNENSISDQIRDMLVCDKLKVPSTWGLTCSWPTSSNYLH